MCAQLQCAAGSVPRGRRPEVRGSAYQEGRARVGANSSPRKQERKAIGTPKTEEGWLSAWPTPSILSEARADAAHLNGLEWEKGRTSQPTPCSLAADSCCSSWPHIHGDFFLSSTRSVEGVVPGLEHKSQSGRETSMSRLDQEPESCGRRDKMIQHEAAWQAESGRNAVWVRTRLLARVWSRLVLLVSEL